MEGENKLVPIIGYIIAILIPIIGVIYGLALVYLKKESPLYQKHGRYLIYFSIAVFIISTIIKLTLIK